MKIIYSGRWVIVTRWLFTVRHWIGVKRTYGVPHLYVHAGKITVAVRLWR